MLKKMAAHGFLGLFFCTMLWITIAAWRGVNQPAHNVWIVCALFCLFFTALYHFICKRADALLPRQFSALITALFLLFTAVATVLGCYTMTYPVSDLEVLCKAVEHWVATGEILDYSFYFTICSNTLGNCIFLYFIFKPLSYVGLFMGSNAAECAAIFINVCLIAFAVFLLYRIATRVLHTQGQLLLFVLLSMSFAPFYLWAHRYYSDTLSMPFAPLAIWLFLRATETTLNRNKIWYGIAIGVCLWVGYFIKGSALIALPALLIFAAFTLPWRTTLHIFTPVILSLCLCFGTWNVYRHNNNWINYENEAMDNFPATMWLLYGAHGQGNYSDADVTYLKTFDNYQDRAVAAKAKLIEYYSAYDAKSYLSFLTTKFTATWSNGKYDAEKYLVASRGGNWTHYFLMEGFPFYALTNYYCNGWHFTFLGMLLLSSFVAFLRPKWDAGLLLRICLFGLIVFLCFWETKPRYLLSFAPFFPLFFAQGVLCTHAIFAKALLLFGLAKPQANPQTVCMVTEPQNVTDDSYISAS